MKINISYGKIAVLLLCIFSFIETGCVNYIKVHSGSIVLPEGRVPLVDGEIKDGVLQTNDLRMEYLLKGSDEEFTFSGQISFVGGITNSYSLLRSFFIRMSFLDEKGKVLSSVDITPLLRTLSGIPDIIECKSSGKRPAGSTAVAFNYYGILMENTKSMGRGEREVFYMPFER